MKYHELLNRQITEFLQDTGSESQLIGLEAFLKNISKSYQSYDNNVESLNNSHQQLSANFQSMLNCASDGLLLMDDSNQVIFINSRILKLLGATREQLVNNFYDYLEKVVSRLIKDPSLFIENIKANRSNRETETVCTIEFKDNTIFEVSSANRFNDGNLIGKMWCFRDISEAKYVDDSTNYRAYHDALTQLPNRYLFSEKVSFALEKIKNNNNKFAILYIDLDGFKFVNDSLGHDVGDMMLVEIANRLKKIIVGSNMIARYGGDEFIAIINNTEDEKSIETLTQYILDSLSKPYHIESFELFTSASIGIAIAPEHGTTVEGIIKRADLAMFSAKNDSKNCYRFFQEDMENESRGELFFKTELNHVLQNKGFSLSFQPKVDMKTKKIIGAEALIRWFKPDGTMVPPEEFIGAAERYGLIVPISEWVFETAAKQLAEWKDLLPHSFVLSVNVSALHLKYPNMLNHLLGIVKDNNIRPEQLELEITESVIMDSPENSIKKLKEIKEYGFTLAIDDFGTGYSSFNYLKMLPIDVLKIDRSFITEIETSPKDLSLVEAIVGIAHLLDLKVVTEGIETEETHELIKNTQCDIGQGYLYGKPVSAKYFERFMIS